MVQITDVSNHPVVSRAEWIEARKALLAKEKDLTRRRDALNAERRALPWVRVETDYVFDGEDGPVRLGDLFDGRSQLAVYHFMMTPGSDHICPGCSLLSDHVDAARQHFENADLSFAAVSRAPLAQLLPVKKRMGWSFEWVSSAGTEFHYDFGVSFREEDLRSGVVEYNYSESPAGGPDAHGVSVFYRNEAGEIFHTYSCYARGAEGTAGVFQWLDLAPKGRNESSTMNWVRLHDEYGQPAHSCCGQ